MFDRINSMPQLKAAKLYISVKPYIEVGGEDVQQTTLESDGREEFQSLHTIQLLPRAPQLGVIHHHAKRHQLQWRFVNLVINKNVLNL